MMSKIARALHHLAPQLVLPFFLKNFIIILSVACLVYFAFFWLNRQFLGHCNSPKPYDDMELFSEDFLAQLGGE